MSRDSWLRQVHPTLPSPARRWDSVPSPTCDPEGQRDDRIGPPDHPCHLWRDRTGSSKVQKDEGSLPHKSLRDTGTHPHWSPSATTTLPRDGTGLDLPPETPGVPRRFSVPGREGPPVGPHDPRLSGSNSSPRPPFSPSSAREWCPGEPSPGSPRELWVCGRLLLLPGKRVTLL